MSTVSHRNRTMQACISIVTGKCRRSTYRLPEVKKPKGAGGATAGGAGEADDTIVGAKPRPDVTQKGLDMVGDFRTDALQRERSVARRLRTIHCLLCSSLAFAGTNVRVDSGAGDLVFGQKRFARHVVRLIDENGKLSFDLDTLRVVARSTLVGAVMPPWHVEQRRHLPDCGRCHRGGWLSAEYGNRRLPALLVAPGAGSILQGRFGRSAPER